MPIRVTIYSKPGCHLCEVMTARLRRASFDEPLDIEEVDITGDPTLLARYETRIPVLMIEGREVASYRIGEEELRQLLRKPPE